MKYSDGRTIWKGDERKLEANKSMSSIFVGFWADVLLLKDEADPKCFSRTEYDLTCFFETPDNKTYDFFYKTDDG